MNATITRIVDTTFSVQSIMLSILLHPIHHTTVYYLLFSILLAGNNGRTKREVRYTLTKIYESFIKKLRMIILGRMKIKILK